MTVYQRPGSPYWWAAVPLPGGGRRRVSTKVLVGTRPRMSQRDAERAAAEVADEEAAKADPRRAREVTLGDALQAHIDGLRADGKPSWVLYSRTRDKMLGRLTVKTGLFRLDGSRPLSSIAPADVTALRNARSSEGVKPGTVAHELRLLRAACNRARQEGYAPPRVDRWRVPVAGHRLRYLTHEEARSLLAHLDPDRPVAAGSKRKLVVPQGSLRKEREAARDMALFAMHTGARADEVNGLTRGAVDLVGGKVTLRGKGNKVREVPLSEPALAMLTRRLAAPGNALVFPGEGGKKRPGPCRAVSRAMDDIGLNPPELVAELGTVSFHSLRHTFAAWMRRAGVALDDLQRLMGHATIAQTQVYAHILPEDTTARVAAVVSGLKVA